MSNKVLGIAGTCRDGTKTPISDERLQELINKINDDGVRACLIIQRGLGLRAEEAVMGYKSLESWRRQLEMGRPVTIIFGTKGGRPRDCRPGNVERAKAAVDFAISIATKQKGKLIAKPSKKQAKDRFTNSVSAAGFVLKEAPHSLRYAFACDQLEHYMAQGFSVQESLALVAMDLGHGDGRGRYVVKVYAKGKLSELLNQIVD
jgi:hypothetical protein